MTPTTPRTIPSILDRIRHRLTRTRSEDIGTNHGIDPVDAIDVLSAERRRFAINHLATMVSGEAIALRELAEHVAAQENERAASEVGSDERTRVYISLLQQHCAVLERADIITYDDDRKIIEPTEQCAQVWRAYQSFRDECTG